MREMRRKDRAVSQEETLQIIKDGEYGVLATVCEDGMPYSVPLSYAYNEKEQAIYIHCAAAGGQKMDNIAYNNHVCFTIVSMTKVMSEHLTTFFKSANVIGTVEIVEEEEEKKRALMAIVEKYAPDHMEKGAEHMEGAVARTGILKIHVEQMTGKARLAK